MITSLSALRKIATQKSADGHLSAADAKAIIAAAGSGAKATKNLEKLLAQFAAVFTGAGKKEMLKAIGTVGPSSETTKISAATRRALMNTLSAVRSNLGEPFPSLPLGSRFVEEPLFSEKHPDGFNFSALIRVGALTPTAKVSDPNQATSCYIKRTGGFAGLTQYFGPFDIVRGAAPKAVVLGEEDNGKTIKVKKGQDVVVSLRKAGGSGYNWFVTRTDRSFGYPVSDESKIKYGGPSMCGGPVYQILTWKTNQPYVHAGNTHQVSLELKRGQSGKAAEKFSFTVEIV